MHGQSDEAFLPAVLTAPPMTDAQFADFCSEHPDLFFEMTAEGELIVMPPNFTLTGIRNREITSQLDRWAFADGRGIVGDSSTGFVLPNGARRSPDASWIAHEKVQRIAEEGIESYWHFCPDFVIELRSHSDRLSVLRAKMREWIENGSQLACLIDPESRSVEIYRPGLDCPMLTGLVSMLATAPVEGFVLNLARVWNPLPLRQVGLPRRTSRL